MAFIIEQLMRFLLDFSYKAVTIAYLGCISKTGNQEPQSMLGGLVWALLPCERPSAPAACLWFITQDSRTSWSGVKQRVWPRMLRKRLTDSLVCLLITEWLLHVQCLPSSSFWSSWEHRQSWEFKVVSGEMPLEWQGSHIGSIEKYWQRLFSPGVIHEVFRREGEAALDCEGGKILEGLGDRRAFRWEQTACWLQQRPQRGAVEGPTRGKGSRFFGWSIWVTLVTGYKAGEVDREQVMEGFEWQIEGCKLYLMDSRDPLKGFQQGSVIIKQTWREIIQHERDILNCFRRVHGGKIISYSHQAWNNAYGCGVFRHLLLPT